MKRIWLILASMLVGCVWTEGNQVSAAEPISIDLTQWKSPDIGTVGDDPFGKLELRRWLIACDHDLFVVVDQSFKGVAQLFFEVEPVLEELDIVH